MRPKKCVLVVGKSELACGHVRLLLKCWGYVPVHVEVREELEAAALRSGRFDAAVVVLPPGADAGADYTIGSVPVVLYTAEMPSVELRDAVERASVRKRGPKPRLEAA